jgi:hypothetical protein
VQHSLPAYYDQQQRSPELKLHVVRVEEDESFLFFLLASLTAAAAAAASAFLSWLSL